jgi:hypothetical protein
MGTLRIIFRVFIPLMFLTIISSCVTSGLQTASLSGLETKSVAHLAKENYDTRFSIRPYYFNNLNHKLVLNTGTHTDVNQNGIYELEGTDDDNIFIEHSHINVVEFSAKNLQYTMPYSSVGFDAEYTVPGKIVTFGLQYGKVDNREFINGLLGINVFLEKAFRLGLFSIFRIQLMMPW